MEHVNEHGQPIGEPAFGWIPPPVPDPALRLTGDEVRLVPLARQHVPGLFEATCGPGSALAWTYMSAGPFDDEAGLTAYLEPMWAAPDWLPLAILSTDENSQNEEQEAEGRVLGMAAFLRIAPAVGSLEVGAVMLGPQLARTRAATEAMWLMAEHAFGLGYRRYEWKCDDLNAPSRSAAVRLGFTYEGTWRRAMVYKGRNRDTAWYAMTDTDWARMGPAIRAWLDETRDGRAQVRSLRELTGG